MIRGEKVRWRYKEQDIKKNNYGNNGRNWNIRLVIKIGKERLKMKDWLRSRLIVLVYLLRMLIIFFLKITKSSYIYSTTLISFNFYFLTMLICLPDLNTCSCAFNTATYDSFPARKYSPFELLHSNCHHRPKVRKPLVSQSSFCLFRTLQHIFLNSLLLLLYAPKSAHLYHQF